MEYLFDKDELEQLFDEHHHPVHPVFENALNEFVNTQIRKAALDVLDILEREHVEPIQRVAEKYQISLMPHQKTPLA
jgi:RNase P subunit RPR2